jgi:hypothetical protein
MKKKVGTIPVGVFGVFGYKLDKPYKSGIFPPEKGVKHIGNISGNGESDFKDLDRDQIEAWQKEGANYVMIGRGGTCLVGKIDEVLDAIGWDDLKLIHEFIEEECWAVEESTQCYHLVVQDNGEVKMGEEMSNAWDGNGWYYKCPCDEEPCDSEDLINHVAKCEKFDEWRKKKTGA